MLANATFFHGDDAQTQERDGGKDSIIPQFVRCRKLNIKKSEKEGRSIFDEYDECHYLIPGDSTFLHKEGVNETHKRRFRRQWEDYQAGREQVNGEPLEAWYELANHPGIIDEMRALKIRSVTDLANTNDDHVGRNIGWREWRDKAKKYVAAQESKAALAEQNASLLAQVTQMSERMAALEAASPQAGIVPEPAPPTVPLGKRRA